MAFHWRNRL